MYNKILCTIDDTNPLSCALVVELAQVLNEMNDLKGALRILENFECNVENPELYSLAENFDISRNAILMDIYLIAGDTDRAEKLLDKIERIADHY